ncbi:MAG TPA: c-type cytochrome [Candidatus Binatia bacterium]|jgi:cytochrome c6
MKRQLTAILLSLAVTAAGAGASFAADSDAGKAVFEKSCVACHGRDGKGNPAMAKALGEKGLNLTAKEVTQKSDDQLLKVIAEGEGKMPAQKSLSKDQQKQVLGYVRSLSK